MGSTARVWKGFAGRDAGRGLSWQTAAPLDCARGALSNVEGRKTRSAAVFPLSLIRPRSTDPRTVDAHPHVSPGLKRLVSGLAEKRQVRHSDIVLLEGLTAVAR